MTTIIAIANEKGGVAKTTTTISVGAAMAECNIPVLLVDLDSQANLSLSLGLEPNKVKRSIANILLDPTPLAAICRPTGITNVSLIPSNSEMGLAERFLPTRKNYEMSLNDLFKNEPLPYEYIILDCPPYLGAVTLNALSACDLLIIPTQPEYFSIYALRSMISVIRRIRLQNNPRLTYRLLLTMHDRRNRTHRSLSEQLRTTFGGGLLETMIDVDTKLRESSMSGKSILAHAPKSRAAIQYRALTQEIMQYVKESAA